MQKLPQKLLPNLVERCSVGQGRPPEISGGLLHPMLHLSFWGNLCMTVHLFFVVVSCYSATYEQVRAKSLPLPILHAFTHCGANLSCSLGWAGKHERTV